MVINFNHAKKVATGCLAMTSCAFFLWVNQSRIQADAGQTESLTTAQFAAVQNTKNSIGGGYGPIPS